MSVLEQESLWYGDLKLLLIYIAIILTAIFFSIVIVPVLNKFFRGMK